MPWLAQKRRYQPYVPDFLSLCERNYAQLRHLLPLAAFGLQDSADVDNRQTQQAKLIQITAEEGYQLRVLEVSRFTSTILIEHVGTDTQSWLRPRFEVRLYHDARLAEVVACQQLRRFKAVYDYPNFAMLQPDEKRQINLLLRDWLVLCQQQGYHAMHSYLQDRT